jgi:hypothetical protein
VSLGPVLGLNTALELPKDLSLRDKDTTAPISLSSMELPASDSLAEGLGMVKKCDQIIGTAEIEVGIRIRNFRRSICCLLAGSGADSAMTRMPS